LAAPTQLRIAFLTIGQAPRDDVVPELMAMLDVGHDRMRCDQFGALDGLTEAEIAAPPRGPALHPAGKRRSYRRQSPAS